MSKKQKTVPILVPIYTPSVVNTAIGKVVAQQIKAGRPPAEIGKKVAAQIKATVKSRIAG